MTNQNEIRDIIVGELKKSKIDQYVLYWITASNSPSTKCQKLIKDRDKILNDFISNVISKLPKWEVIASGEMKFNSQECFYSIGEVSIIYTAYVKILEKLAKYLGKQIELGVKIK